MELPLSLSKEDATDRDQTLAFPWPQKGAISSGV
ncbi:hypothetical protein HAL1_07120 [Halomonas sp. HAL1]|nr:hypothetical protein HAL1_07120 [Halomonas sp. HAL1]